MGQAKQAQVSLESLQRAAAFVRRELSQRIRMYRIPEIRFQLDPDMVTEESIAQRSSGNDSAFGDAQRAESGELYPNPERLAVTPTGSAFPAVAR